MSTIATLANRNYANRPKDERFPSVDAMIANAIDQKAHSKEVTYNAKDLRARDFDGSVVLDSPKGSAKFTHWSFGQLARSVGAPAGYLRDLPAVNAAADLNFGLSKAENATDIKLLVQAPNGDPTPTVRAATTESYGRVWDADLYGAINSQILQHDDKWTTPPTWSGEPAGAYRGDRDSYLVVVNGGSIVNDPSLSSGDGRMFRGFMVRNSEVGGSSVWLDEFMFRWICGNHQIGGFQAVQGFRRKHTGPNALRDTIRAVMQLARSVTTRSAAQDEAIIRGLIDHEIAHTKDAVVDELQAIGFAKGDAIAAYERCERTEAASPRSFWGIAQGATRLSQDSGYQNDRFELDQLAAKVLARGRQLVTV